MKLQAHLSSRRGILEVTAFGCDPDEAAAFRDRARDFGITPIITAAPLSLATVHLAAGSPCISISHKTPVAEVELDALREVGVRYVSTRSIGFDHIDVAYAQSIGITVENVPYSPDSVADFTLMLMLMVVRHAKSVIRRVDVHDYRPHEVRGRELRDLSVGVVGTGRIGQAVIDRLHGFGCRILAHDPREHSPVEYVSLDELLRESDIVTLHIPLDESTHHLLDGRRLGLMKVGAYVINTGRGSLIDTRALVAALESGSLDGAALDVLEGEERIFHEDRGIAPTHEALLRLHKLPNVLITPHTAYFTDHALTDTVAGSLANCLKFEKGPQHG